MPEIKPADFESLVGMIVHDLRNPAATMGANVSFVREVIDDPELDRVEIGEALADAQQALHDLTRGLDQLSFIGRWANGTQPIAEELRERAFTLEGQSAVKGRADGRYSRVAGLFVASLLAQSIGAKLEPLERDRCNVFLVLLSRAA